MKTTDSDILRLRLYNQHLARQTFRHPQELVAWLGAVQAQDYPAAKWGVAQRLQGTTDALLERAFAAGTILRTHVMRPTWHFVARDDIRWMLSLTAPRVTAILAPYDRKLEVDAATLARSQRALARALHGGKTLTRPELGAVLQKAGIAPGGLIRLAMLMRHAELAGLVCSGAPRGRHHTYALLEERAPAANVLPREEALAELATRYFVSHGPATVKDYAWWSGLTSADAKTSVEMIASRLTRAEVNGRVYWWSAATSVPSQIPAVAYLLPNFDEYIIGYTDRSAMWDGSPTDPRANILFKHTVLLDGRVVGSWKRTLSDDGVTLLCSARRRFGKKGKLAIAAAAERYERFLERRVSVRFEKR